MIRVNKPIKPFPSGVVKHKTLDIVERLVKKLTTNKITDALFCVIKDCVKNMSKKSLPKKAFEFKN